jgi:hypothetical protein
LWVFLTVRTCGFFSYLWVRPSGRCYFLVILLFGLCFAIVRELICPGDRAGIIIGSAPHVLWASVFLIALASTPAVVAVLPPLVPTE